jgi:hypothetical protein
MRFSAQNKSCLVLQLFLLFKINTKTDAGAAAEMKQHACAFISMLEEYKKATDLEIV